MMSKSKLGESEMPASRKERDLIIRCSTDINHIKKDVDRLEKTLRNHVGEEKETERYITTKKLTILMIIATIIGTTFGSVILWVLTKYLH